MKFTIPGEPCGKARPRVVRVGNMSRTYTPEKTVSYENLVKLEFQQSANGFFAKEGPVRVQIAAYFSLPKSASKKKSALMQAGKIRPTKKPDWDNIGKIVCDALNGIAFKDDSQVVEATVTKQFSTLPRVEVIIEEAKSRESLFDLNP